VVNLRHHDGSVVASLEQVIDLVGNRARLNIELKGPDCAPAVAALVQKKVASLLLDQAQTIVSSFDHQQLQWLQQHAPSIKRGVLVYGLPHDGLACCQALNAYSFHCSVDFIDTALIKTARQQGLEVWVYTVNRVDDFEELQGKGVTGIFTDDPKLLIDFNKTNSSA